MWARLGNGMGGASARESPPLPINKNAPSAADDGGGRAGRRQQGDHIRQHRATPGRQRRNSESPRWNDAALPRGRPFLLPRHTTKKFVLWANTAGCRNGACKHVSPTGKCAAYNVGVAESAAGPYTFVGTTEPTAASMQHRWDWRLRAVCGHRQHRLHRPDPLG